MGRMKNYIISIIVMILSTTLFLVVISMFTYLLKWQADKVMVGIMITYVLAGFTGGFCLRRRKKIGIQRMMIDAGLLGTVFMFLLVLFSYFIFQIPFEFSSRFLLIWMLIVCGSFGGICCKR